MNRKDRDETQARWMDGTVPVMVATTAFGMGIDKANVRTVVHYDAPEHLEAYYQEAGRAGRDGKPATALLLYNNADLRRLQESTALQYPPEEYLRQVYQCAAEYLQIPIGAEPDKYYPFDVFDFCRKFGLQANNAIHALKLLEQEGLWTLSEAVHSPATIQFTADRHELDRLKEIHPDLGYVATGLLRMYNTIFHYPTPVRETAIARQLKMRRDELNAALEQLSKMELLHYNRPSEGPQMFFHHYRVDSRHLLINMQRIARLRQRHERRTAAMLQYLQGDRCRERSILAYFGQETVDDCGHCDACARKQRSFVNPKELEQRIATNPGLTIEALIKYYPAAAKENVLEILRTMLDNNAATLTEGVLHIKKRSAG